VESIRLLLEAGASTIYDSKGCINALIEEIVPDHISPKIEIVKLICKAGVDINAVQSFDDGTQATALIAACKKERLDLVQFLVQSGANPNEQLILKILKAGIRSAGNNISALSFSILHEQESIFNFLLKQKNQPISFITAVMSLASFMNDPDYCKVNISVGRNIECELRLSTIVPLLFHCWSHLFHISTRSNQKSL
jgi:ankyrin repeat protein